MSLEIHRLVQADLVRNQTVKLLMSENPLKSETVPFIKAELGKNGVKMFYTLAEFEEWFRREMDWWTRISQKVDPRRNRNLDQLTRWDNTTNQIQSHLPTLKNPNIAPQEKQSPINDIQAQLNRSYTQGLILSTSAEGKYLESALEKNSEFGYGVLAAFARANVSIDGQHPDAWEGFILGLLFRLGLSKRLPSEKASLENLENEWRKNFEKVRSELESLATKGHSQTSALDQQTSDQKFQFEELVQRVEKDWTELKQRLETEVAFKTPVKYWNGKSKAHFWTAVAWGFILVVGGGISIGFLVSKIIPLLDPKVQSDYSHAALIILIAAFLFWALRIPTKMFLSAIHLKSDADQRSTMLQTYIALEMEGKMKATEDRKLILEAIFRPVTMGVVKEDQTPVSPLETIVNKFGG